MSENTLYTQSVAGCFDRAVGEHGLSEEEVRPFLQRADESIERLRKAAGDGSLPLLSIWKEKADLEACAPVVQHLTHKASDLVVLGTGGSSLGAQALAQLTGYGMPGFACQKNKLHIHFFDNLDPDSYAAALSHLDLATTRFLVISKSGSTAETIMQMLAAIGALEEAGHGKNLSAHFAVIVSAGDSPLSRLAEDLGCPVLEHEADIGGRFSVLSNVGLLPALALGLDAGAVRAGAGALMQPILKGVKAKDFPPALAAAVGAALAKKRGCSIHVLMPYGDKLALFAKWFRQLWAESLGKHEEGTTPIAALGPVDQHSQLQLYLDGPRDKMMTMLITGRKGSGPRIDKHRVSDHRLDYLAGRTIGDLMEAQQRAVAETLIRNGRPVRLIHIPELNEWSLGTLFMHFMLETIIIADLFSVFAFDQPAVEEGKVLARRYLSEMDE